MEATVSSRVLKRAEKELRQTKVILRHLPPDYTKDKLQSIIDPLLSFSYFTFVPGDPVLGKFGCSRAYINFEEYEDIVPFRDRYDGMVLETEKRVKYRIIIELAPYQTVPRVRMRPDHRCGTIAEDPDYKEFLEKYEQQINPLPSIDVTYLHEVEKMKVGSQQATPLTEYLRDKYSTPRGQRGSGQKNKVLYATGSKKKRDKMKELTKGRGKGRKDNRGSDGKSWKESSTGKTRDTAKVIIVEKHGHNGISEDKTMRGSGSKVVKATDSPSGHSSGKYGGPKQPDQQLFVAGKGRKNNEGMVSKKDVKRDEGSEVRKPSGRRNNRDGYGKYGRGQYNDRRDNHYDFKEDDDNYQGPDYGSKSGGKSPRQRHNDYGSEDRRSRYYGRNQDRYDNGSKGGWDKGHK